jgi:hypothetical protein
MFYTRLFGWCKEREKIKKTCLSTGHRIEASNSAVTKEERLCKFSVLLA